MGRTAITLFELYEFSTPCGYFSNTQNTLTGFSNPSRRLPKPAPVHAKILVIQDLLVRREGFEPS